MAKNKPDPDCLNPSPALLAKLGSIIVHVEEGVSGKGHHFDFVAIQSLMADTEVKEWLQSMDKMALLPKKR